MKLLSYDTKNPVETKRSFQEEWAPHLRQTNKSFEWWYLTASVHDVQGNPYFIYIGAIDHIGEIMQKRLIGKTLPPEMRTIALTATLSDYNAEKTTSPAGLAVMPAIEMFDDETNILTLNDGRGMVINWQYVDDKMKILVDSKDYIYDFTVTHCDDGLWHKDSLGTEGMIQEGPEGDYSFYYSLTNCTLEGKVKLKNEDGNISKEFEVYGRAWVDRQWGDFCSTYWEWSSFRFANGATMHLYNFYNGHQEGLYRDTDGNVQYFDNVLIKQNGYCKAPLANTWQSWGWSYEFPIEIEGSKHYTVKPKSNQEFLQFPDMECEFEGEILHGYAIYEGLGDLINDETGELVGVSVNESIDVRAMKNMPHGPNQN